MLARLWRWLLPDGRRKPMKVAHEVGSGRASVAATETRDAAPATPRQELFFEQLAREHPQEPPVAEADESRISTLVLEVVKHLARKKVEPPVMPALVPRVLAIVDEREVDLARLTRVIEQDLAIGAKLLSVANSPLFAGGAEIHSVRQAVAHLGTEQVAQIAIGLACSSSFEGDPQSPFAGRWRRLFHHGMTCAFSAAHLASKRGRAAQEAAFLSGLFHDVGKAVALRAIETLSASGQLQPLDEALVEEALHRIHAYPGDEFYEKWTLPAPLMELCARHHQLDALEEGDETVSIVGLVSSFDALRSGSAAERRDALSEARACADRLGLTEDALQALYKQTRAFAERTTRMFAKT